eukprot:Selendium_serpulae@DN5274_c0_g1_i2.p1
MSNLDELDFRSSAFDPQKALKADSLLLPAPHVRHLDSIIKAERLLPFAQQPSYASQWSARLRDSTKADAFREIKAVQNRELALRYRSRIQEVRNSQTSCLTEFWKHLTVAKHPLFKCLESAVKENRTATITSYGRGGFEISYTGIPVWFDNDWNILLKDAAENVVTRSGVVLRNSRSKWVVVR